MAGTRKLSRFDKTSLRKDVKEGILSDVQIREKYKISQHALAGFRRFNLGEPIHSTKGTSVLKSHERNYEDIPEKQDSQPPQEHTPPDTDTPTSNDGILYQCGSCGGHFHGRIKTCPHCNDVFIWEDD